MVCLYNMVKKREKKTYSTNDKCSDSELFLFMLLPFIWWLWRQKESSFLDWIGFKPLKIPAIIRCGSGYFLVLLSYIFPYLVLYTKRSWNTASSFAGLGYQAQLFLFIVFSNFLPEELLFRGFLLKDFPITCLLE